MIGVVLVARPCPLTKPILLVLYSFLHSQRSHSPHTPPPHTHKMSAPLARAVPFRAAAVKSASRAATAPRFALAGPSHNVHCYSSSSRTSQRARLPVECSARTRPAYNARRTLATSSSQSIRDAEHPTGLWYHPLPGSSDLKRYAVSYLSQAPSSNDAQDVIAVVEVTGDSDPATFSRQNPDRVKANPAFWKLLHDTLKEDVVAGGKDAILTQEADLREDGWAHLAGECGEACDKYDSTLTSCPTDQRQLLMPGRSESGVAHEQCGPSELTSPTSTATHSSNTRLDHCVGLVRQLQNIARDVRGQRHPSTHHQGGRLDCFEGRVASSSQGQAEEAVVTCERAHHRVTAISLSSG